MTAELTLGGVNSACHPPEVSNMSTSVLVEGHSISGTAVLQEMVGVVTRPRLCQIAKEQLLWQFQCSVQECGPQYNCHIEKGYNRLTQNKSIPTSRINFVINVVVSLNR